MGKRKRMPWAPATEGLLAQPGLTNLDVRVLLALRIVAFKGEEKGFDEHKRVTQGRIAAAVAATRPSISKSLSRLEREWGLVESTRTGREARAYRLVDPDWTRFAGGDHQVVVLTPDESKDITRGMPDVPKPPSGVPKPPPGVPKPLSDVPKQGNGSDIDPYGVVDAPPGGPAPAEQTDTGGDPRGGGWAKPTQHVPGGDVGASPPTPSGSPPWAASQPAAAGDLDLEVADLVDEEVDRGEARLRELGIDEDEEDDDHLTDDGREGDDHLTDDVEGDARPDGDVEGDARPDGDGDTPPGGEEEPGGPPDGVRHPQGPRTPRKRKRNATTAQAPLTAEALLADPGAREFDWAGAAGGWGELRVAAIRYTEIDAKYDEWIWLTWIRRRDDRWGTARIGNYPASLPWRMWSEAVATVEAEPERGAMLHCDGAASHLLAVWLHRRARAKPYPGRGLIRKLADQLTRDEGTVPGELGDLVPKNHPAVRDVLQGLKDWARESKAGIQLDAQAVWHEIRDEYRRKVGPRLRAAR